MPLGWRSQCTGSGDAYHLNSVEPDGDGYVLSFRHLDAVYRIDRETGDIDWKLGGVHRAESLAVIDDPLSLLSTFGGQHDARILPDGTLTVFDDGTLRRSAHPAPSGSRSTRPPVPRPCSKTSEIPPRPRPPAAARPADCRAGTGSHRGAQILTSLSSTANGDRVFTLTFTQNFASYRANPLLPGVVSREALRAGMDAQFPR